MIRDDRHSQCVFHSAPDLLVLISLQRATPAHRRAAATVFTPSAEGTTVKHQQAATPQHPHAFVFGNRLQRLVSRVSSIDFTHVR